MVAGLVGIGVCLDGLQDWSKSTRARTLGQVLALTGRNLGRGGLVDGGQAGKEVKHCRYVWGVILKDKVVGENRRPINRLS